MRTNTPRELLLQNLLAVSSVLLFRSTKVLVAGSTSQREAMIIEIEEWFEESKASIEAQVREDMRAVGIPEPIVSRPLDSPWTPPQPNVPILDTAAVELTEKLNYFLR